MPLYLLDSKGADIEEISLCLVFSLSLILIEGVGAYMTGWAIMVQISEG